mgnify:CR=1 FL=1
MDKFTKKDLSKVEIKALASQLRCSRTKCPSNHKRTCAEIEFGDDPQLWFDTVQCEQRIRTRMTYHMASLMLGAKIVVR